MKRMNLEPKKVKDSKEKNSKNEIKKKLEARKKKNSAKVHTIVEFLSEQKSKFLNEVKPLGYNQNMVEEIMMNGLQAKEFNLVSEIVAKLEREIQEKEMQPMQIRKLDADYSELLPSLVKSNLIDEEEMKVRPDRKDLYIRDKVPEKKSKEW